MCKLIGQWKLTGFVLESSNTCVQLCLVAMTFELPGFRTSSVADDAFVKLKFHGSSFLVASSCAISPGCR